MGFVIGIVVGIVVGIVGAGLAMYIRLIKDFATWW